GSLQKKSLGELGNPRETKRPNQTNGQYAAGLLAKLNKINEKLREVMEASASEAWMIFMTTVLKVQLAKDTGRRRKR
ncbi:hypothetical protein ACUWC3_28450, partial [Klebsiella pneumoniae]|uniref:hypothetical protein n=1 Tax=Klebsiella pneumoniae TaxID=573 RepID=UPI0040556F88